MSLAFERFFMKTCLYVWQLVRVCIAVVLVASLGWWIFLAATAPDTPDLEVSAGALPICGRLSGNKIVLPRNYVMFWPEYEGASSWDKASINNKRGCEAQLVSLPLVMTWPQLQPANSSEYFRDGLRFSGLEVVIAPIAITTFDLRTRLEALLSDGQREKIEAPAYVESLDLYVVERKDRTFSDVVNAYYWKEHGGKVETVFECLGNKDGNGHYNCQAEFVMAELAAHVKVGFAAEKLKEWDRIESAVKNFILSSVEK